MYFKYHYLACIICAVSGLVRTEETPKTGHELNKKLNISIFYETFDPSSIKFFTNKFDIAYSLFEDFIEVHFVPFGHGQAEMGKVRDRITCENGDIECYGNRVHACAVQYLSTSTSDQVKFIVCTMNNTDITNQSHQAYPIKKCVDLLSKPNFDEATINNCLASKDTLMEKMQNATKEIGTFDKMPAITVNSNKYDKDVSDHFANNFLNALCQRFGNATSLSNNAAAYCTNLTPVLTTSLSPPTPPSSAAINSITYWPIIAIILSVLFEVNLR